MKSFLLSSASIQQMQTQIADLEEDKENLATNNENLNSVVMEKGLEIEGLKQANEAHIKRYAPYRRQRR